MSLLRKQLEEIHLLRCSLIPPELFAFVLPEEDGEQWSELLRTYTENGESPDDDCDSRPTSTCRFEVRIENVPIWFQVELPRGYIQKRKDPSFSGENLQRAEQDRWREIINDRLDQITEERTEFQVQNLLCLHLIPLLHEKLNALQSESAKTASNPPSSFHAAPLESGSERYHVLFTSHHLVSPTKRRNLQRWSAELSLRGFAKVGYPGTIYAEGSQADVSDFVGRVKAMQWLALKVRFEEKLDLEKYGELKLGIGNEIAGAGADEGRGRSARWIELEKVGEVVEIMRHSGREELVTEMGLGTSSGNASAGKA